MVIQWSNSKYAGFSTAKPWQKENESYTEINAETQVGVKDSVFEHWSSVLRLRKLHKDVFIYGDFELLDEKHKDVFTYARTFEKQKVIVVANFRTTAVTWSVPKDIRLQKKNILISNYSDTEIKDGSVSLRPFEAIVFSAN
jgi:glycosidase